MAPKRTRSISSSTPAKRSRSSCVLNSPSTSTFRPAINENSNDLSNYEYVGTGLKTSLHGAEFQLNLLMLILWRAHIHELPEFRLATELPESGKFDDVVFFRKCDRTQKSKVRMYQAKHKEAEKFKLIKQSDLLSQNDETPWQLSKYMQSFVEILKKCQSDSMHPLFHEVDIEEVVIITNADIDDDMLKYLDECVEGFDHFDGFKNSEMKKYTFKTSFVNEFGETINQGSDFRKLIHSLAQAVKDKKMYKREIIKKYIYPLQKVLCKDNNGKIQYAKFTDNFLTSEEFSEFREQLYTEVKSLIKSLAEAPVKDILEFLKNVKMEISAGFAQDLTIKNISNPQKFAEQFNNCINDTKEFKISLEFVGATSEVADFETNVCVLGSERVLVKAPSKIHFSTSFIKERITNQSIKDFRKLIDPSIVDTLHEYSFDIKLKQFAAEPEEYLERTLPKPFSQKSYERFLEKLRLVVKYPNREEIVKLLDEEMKTHYKNLNSKALEALLKVILQNWMTNRVGTFYTAEKVRNLFEQVETNVSCLHWQGVNVSYFAECPKLEFKNHQLDDYVQDFLKNPKMRTASAVFQSLLIGRIRVIQSFFTLQSECEGNVDGNETLQRYTRMFGYIFVKLNQFNDKDFYDNLSKICTVANQWNLIVIECDVAEEKQNERLEEFLNQYGVNRKVILIMQENNIISLNGIEVHKFSTTSVDLTESSWAEIGGKSIKCQGKEAVLSDLIDRSSRHLVDAQTLEKLVKGEQVEIGGELKYSTGYDPKYYILRLVLKILIKEDFLSACKGRDKVIVSDSEEEFINECKKCDNAARNIHWLQRNSKSCYKLLIWRQTYGCVDDLREYCFEKNETSFLVYDKFDMKEIDLVISNYYTQKLIVISDPAGMGKSTIISSLSAQFKSKFNNLWVVRIELNEHCAYLDGELQARKKGESLLKPKDPDSSCTFLMNMVLRQNNSNFDIKFLRHALIRETSLLKAVVLFDGFDEISPDYAEIIFDLVQGLLLTQLKKMIITTRPAMERELATRLNVLVHHLCPLEGWQQEKFLYNFWRTRLSCYPSLKFEIDSLIRSLVSRLGRDKSFGTETAFVSNPLPLRMLAEVFEEQMKDLISKNWKNWKKADSEADGMFTRILPQGLRSCNLYSLFIEMKIKIYFKEKMGQDLSNLAAKSELDKKFEKLNKNLRLFAVLALFYNADDDQLRVLKTLFLPLDTPYNKQMKKIRSKIKRFEKDSQDRIGLINSIVDGRPIFAHRTIAEYLFVCYVGEMLTKERQPTEFLEYFCTSLLRTEWFLPFWDGWLSEERNRIRIADETKFKIGTIVKRVYLNDQLKIDINFHLLCFLVECFRNETDIYIKIKCKDYKKLLDFVVQTNQFSILNAIVAGNYKYSWVFVTALLKSKEEKIWNWACSYSEEIKKDFVIHAFREGTLDAWKFLHSNNIVDFVNFVVLPNGGRSIHVAAIYGKIPIIDWLVRDIGVDKNVRDRNGLSIFDFAVLGKRTKLIEHLLLPIKNGGHGMDIHVNQSLIHAVCGCSLFRSSGCSEFIDWLLSLGADINAVRDDGMTPLRSAAIFLECHRDIYDFLRRYSPRYNSAFHLATRLQPYKNECQVEIMEHLIKKGADPTLRDKNGRTVLHCAAAAGNLNSCKWLIRNSRVLDELKASDIPEVLDAAKRSGNEKLLKGLTKALEAEVINPWELLNEEEKEENEISENKGFISLMVGTQETLLSLLDRDSRRRRRPSLLRSDIDSENDTD